MGAAQRLVLRWRSAAVLRVRTGWHAGLEVVRGRGTRLTRLPLVRLGVVACALALGALLCGWSFAGPVTDGGAAELAAGALLLCAAGAVATTEVSAAVRSRETRAASREAVQAAEEIVREHREEGHAAVTAAEALLHRAWRARHPTG